MRRGTQNRRELDLALPAEDQPGAVSERVTGSNSLDKVALCVGLIGHEIVGHEPPELREHMATLSARLSRATATDSRR